MEYNRGHFCHHQIRVYEVKIAYKSFFPSPASISHSVMKMQLSHDIVLFLSLCSCTRGIPRNGHESFYFFPLCHVSKRL